MGIDSSIYSQLRPNVAPADPLEQYGKALSLQNMVGQGDLHALQLQKLRKDMAGEETFQKLFAGGAQPTEQQAIGADVTRGMAYSKALREREEKQAQIVKLNLESNGLAVKALADEVAKMQPGQDTTPLRAVVGKLFKADDAARMIAAMPPTATPEWIQKSSQNAQILNENLRNAQTTKTTERGQDMTAATAATGQNVTMRGQDMTSASAAAGRSVTMRGQNMVDARSRDANGLAADGTLTPEAEAQAKGIAEGRLAPLTGFALNKPGGRAVMGRVMQINPEYRGGDFAVGVAGEKGFLSKNGPQIRGFNVVIDHLDTAQGLYDALKNGDVQAINTAKNAFQKQFGSAAPTSLDAAKQFIAAEAVRAVSGAAGALGDRQQMEKNLATNLSDAQFLGTVNTIKDLALGQMTGHEQQYQSVVGPERAKEFADKFLTPKAKALYEKKRAATPPAAGAAQPVPSILKKNADGSYNYGG